MPGDPIHSVESDAPLTFIGGSWRVTALLDNTTNVAVTARNYRIEWIDDNGTAHVLKRVQRFSFEIEAGRDNVGKIKVEFIDHAAITEGQT